MELDSYLKSNIFRDKHVLTNTWVPRKEQIIHLDSEITQIVKNLGPIVRGESPSNMLIFGPPGSGKTLSTLHIKKMFDRIPNSEGFSILYVKCMNHPSEYLVLYKISELLELGFHGTRIHRYYSLLENHTKEKRRMVVVVLDEIDRVRNINSLIFSLSRMENITIIGISNDMTFTEKLEKRTNSSFNPKTVMFKKYNAVQLAAIMDKRVDAAFKSRVLEDGVVSKCAALCAQESGDARQAIDLLRISGELADEAERRVVSIKHVDLADELLDTNAIVSYIKTCTPQSRAVMSAVIGGLANGVKKIDTRELMDGYEKIAKKANLRILTPRRVSDIVSELSKIGILNAEVVSLGRYGVTKHIQLSLTSLSLHRIKKTLKDEGYYEELP